MQHVECEDQVILMGFEALVARVPFDIKRLISYERIVGEPLLGSRKKGGQGQPVVTTAD